MPQPSTVVASGSFNQFSGNLAPTAIYTPLIDSLVIVSFYETLITASTLNKVQVAWNDGLQNRAAEPDTFNTAWGNFATLPVFVAAGQTLSLATLNALPTDLTTIHYAVELVLPISLLPTYSVVANLLVPNQQGDQIINAYTVPADGIYRGNFTTDSSNEQIGQFTVNWQSADGTHNTLISPRIPLTFPIHALANTQIQIICKGNTGPAPIYNVYFTLEQLA